MSDNQPETQPTEEVPQQPQMTADDLLASIDELQAQLASLQQRTVLLNKEIRFRDRKITQLEAVVAEKAGFKHAPEEEVPPVDEP